jgi:hypothetical protein
MMLDSVPLPLQAIFWLLAGATIILAVGRLMPNWLRRLVALSASVASFAALWSLRSDAVNQVEIYWEPLNLFRMNALLHADSLSLALGIILVSGTAVLVLGVRGLGARRTLWHGLILLTMAGILLMLMAANIPTLALGSGLVDLTLIAMAVLATGDTGRGTWRMAVPGAASTLLLVAAGLQMSTEVGSTVLSAARVTDHALLFVGIAGLLRILIYPLHPRRLGSPQNAATLILLVGSGLYLLARVQGIAPVLAGQAWVFGLSGIALLGGAVIAWTGGGWSSVAIYQTGLALAVAYLVTGRIPWFLMGFVCALGMLAIWWDSSLDERKSPRPDWLEWFVQVVDSAWAALITRIESALPAQERWRETKVFRYRIVLLPTIALLSLAGAPFTVGALSRWALYGRLLEASDVAQLILVVVADTFLVAALWALIRRTLEQISQWRPGAAALAAMVAFAFLVVVIGIAPGLMEASLDQSTAPAADVPVLGLGLVYVLPWLLGSWLAHTGISRSPYLSYVRKLLHLDWLFRSASWIGQQVSTGVFWLGRVGEGDGWWGWALIILALGAIFLSSR